MMKLKNQVKVPFELFQFACRAKWQKEFVFWCDIKTSFESGRIKDYKNYTFKSRLAKPYDVKTYMKYVKRLAERKLVTIKGKSLFLTSYDNACEMYYCNTRFYHVNKNVNILEQIYAIVFLLCEKSQKIKVKLNQTSTETKPLIFHSMGVETFNTTDYQALPKLSCKTAGQKLGISTTAAFVLKKKLQLLKLLRITNVKEVLCSEKNKDCLPESVLAESKVRLFGGLIIRQLADIIETSVVKDVRVLIKKSKINWREVNYCTYDCGILD